MGRITPHFNAVNEIWKYIGMLQARKTVWVEIMGRVDDDSNWVWALPES